MKRLNFNTADDADQLNRLQLLVRLDTMHALLAGQTEMPGGIDQGIYDQLLAGRVANALAKGDKRVIASFALLTENLNALKRSVRADLRRRVTQGTPLAEIDPASDQGIALDNYIGAYTLRQATEGALFNDVREGMADPDEAVMVRAALADEFSHMNQSAADNADALLAGGATLPAIRQMQMQTAMYLNALLPEPLRLNVGKLRGKLYNPGSKRIGYDRQIPIADGLANDLQRSSINHDTEVLRQLQVACAHGMPSPAEVMDDPNIITSPANIAMQSSVVVDMYDYARAHAPALVGLLDKTEAYEISTAVVLAARAVALDAGDFGPVAQTDNTDGDSTTRMALHWGNRVSMRLTQPERDLLGRFVYGYIVSQFDIDATDDAPQAKLLGTLVQNALQVSPLASLTNGPDGQPKPQ